MFNKDYNDLEDLCRSCAGVSLDGFAEVPCTMMDCPIFYNKRLAKDCVQQLVPALQDAIRQIDGGISSLIWCKKVLLSI